MKYEPLMPHLETQVKSFILPHLGEAVEPPNSLSDLDKNTKIRMAALASLFNQIRCDGEACDSCSKGNVLSDATDRYGIWTRDIEVIESEGVSQYQYQLDNPSFYETLAIGAYGDVAYTTIRRWRRELKDISVHSQAYEDRVKSRFPASLTPKLIIDSRECDVIHSHGVEINILPASVVYITTPDSEPLTISETLSKAIDLIQAVTNLKTVANSTNLISSYVKAKSLNI